MSQELWTAVDAYIKEKMVPADDVLTADALSALFGHQLTEVGTGSSRTLLPV